jgi:hypothetical protein
MWTLEIIRTLRCIRRRLFGKKLPHYVKEPLGLVMGPIKLFNFLRLIPTLQIMVCAPNHFFRSLPSILDGKKTYYVSPLQFPINVATLQILALAFLPKEIPLPKELPVVGKTFKQIYIIAIDLGFAALSPVVMAIACGVILILWYGGRATRPFNKLIPVDLLNCHAVLIPLSPSTYRALDVNRFFWSLVYYFIYFYLTFFIVFGFFVTCAILLVLAHENLGVPSNVITFFSAVLGLITALAGYWVFVRPYIFLLMHASRRITKLMMRAAVHSGIAWVLRKYDQQQTLPAGN